MSIIGAIGIGLGLGKFASGLMFKYTQNVYIERIGELDDVIAKLGTHLTNLTNLRNEIPGFWDDEDAKKALDTIDLNIQKVTTQLGTAKDMAKLLRDTVDSLESGKSGLSEKIEDAKSLLNILEL